MRDAGHLRDVLRDMLKVELPRKIGLLRAAWQMDATELPDVDQITSGEPTDHALTSMGDTWITVVNPRLFKTDQVDIDPTGLPVYLSRYSARIYVWAKMPDWVSAMQVRDRLAVVVRLALLEWPNMKPGVYGDTGYRLHRNTYTEQFGEPLRLDSRAGNRVWAPAVLSIDVEVEESLVDGSTRPPLGAADEVTPGGEVVGPTEPLPDTA